MPSCPARGCRCVHPQESQDPYRRRDHRSDRRAEHRPGHPAPVAGGRAPNQDGGGGVLRSRLRLQLSRARFRSARPPRRCRWNTTRATCSSACSAAATRPAERKALGEQYDSILDMVHSDAATMRSELGRARPRGARATTWTACARSSGACRRWRAQDLSQLKLPAVPMGIPEQFPQQQMLMFDMIALAFQANLTRIATMMMAAEVSNMTYNFIGVPDAFHPVSHHQGDADEDREAGEDPDLPHARRWPSSSSGWRIRPTAMARCCDHSMILYGSNMSNSNAHDQYPLPTARARRGLRQDEGRPASAATRSTRRSRICC